jgi:beta-1,4-mannosyltransferase
VFEVLKRQYLAAFPLVEANPYQRLLYAQLAHFGLRLAWDAQFRFGWLWRSRRSVGVLHFHWPQAYWSRHRRPTRFAQHLSWLKLPLFALRLRMARLLGYRIVWTVHQLLPHEVLNERLDRVGAAVLARSSHVLIAHDDETAATVEEHLGISRSRITVIPHGSYVGVYDEGRSREVVRAELGIPVDAFLFLCFGHIREYKGVEFLLKAFSSIDFPGIALLIAGAPMDDRCAAEVRNAAAADRRIATLLELVPEERVAELFNAADAAVLPRSDGGTSGALVLALSLGLPPIVAAQPAYLTLIDNGIAGWSFDPSDAESLTETMRAVAADPAAVREKRAAAQEQASALDWNSIGRRTVEAITAAN